VQSHRRLNALTGEWVLVSPGRDQRPWGGQVEKPAVTASLPFDPSCYLCPGNSRAGGVRNPDYADTFVFDNDFGALQPAPPEETGVDTGLLQSRPERGICRVVCFSPRHDLTLSQMSADGVRHVVDVWAAQYDELRAKDFIRWVQIFENRGEMMGCSNSHPHGQIWAASALPNEGAKELATFEDRASCVLCDYLTLETQSRERLVCENAGFVAVVPFWAVWPFEVLVTARRHVADLAGFHDSERADLAGIMQQVTRRYDALFHTPFPYTMGLHQLAHDRWHFHAHYYPPLLRSATVKKHMVGYEMLAMPQRDLTPESAAERLRNVPFEVSIA
jgi:UDPglucose--hexose-1-phosphate uridylyltransferase